MTLRLTFALCLALVACKDNGAADDSGDDQSVDADGDGFTEDEDCDDSDAAIHPDAAEVCDGVDNNCDQLADDNDPNVDLSGGGTWWYDHDLDGYGDDDGEVTACAQPANALPAAGDCDGTNARIHPDAAELCDALDNDCDGAVDDDDDDFTGELINWYTDNDGDGYGAAGAGTLACEVPSGGADNGEDCDDDDASAHPGNREVCDGVDNDCDGDIDDPAQLYGSDSACAASSCVDAADTLNLPSSGLYWIDPDGTGAFEAYCDMDTDGGGWTLVMRCVADNFLYDDSVWESTDVYDDSNYDFSAAGCSKYAAYNSVPFDELRSSTTDDWEDDFVQGFEGTYSSALELFSGDGFELSTELQDFWNDNVDPESQHWGCDTYLTYGINQLDYLGEGFLNGGSVCDWNGGARWGQRVNAYHSATGDHSGQGWGAYSTIITGDDGTLLDLYQLMWVRESQE